MEASAFKAKRRLDYKKPDFTATDIELTFQLSDDKTVVRSSAHYIRQTSDLSVPLRLDGEELLLNDVLLNGEPCKYTVTDTELIVCDVPSDFELTTEVVISPASNTSLMGLYKSCGCFCTQCEPDGFRKITYFLDRPDVLAKYRVTVIGPEYGCGVLLSNGNLIDSGVKDGRNFTVWEDPFPKPSYLFALVAGSFDILQDTYTTKSGRKVKLELYVDRGAFERGKWALESIKTAMAWDEKRFNLEYDLDNFKVVAVDFFNFGAMENKSLNIFNSSCVLVSQDTATDLNYFNVQGVIGHEYFHNWTGDRVTLRDWFQLSLKESLTTFRDQEFSSDVNSRILTRLAAIDLIRSRQFAEDAGPMAHPVRPEQVMEMNNFYTVTIYDKGAEVIRMIHTILGEEKFQKGVAYYLSHFDGSAATIEDFILSMETASMTDLSQFRRWYSQAGTPQVHATWHIENGKLLLTLTQETPPTPGQKTKEPFVIPIATSFINAEGETIVPPELPDNGVLMLTKEQQTFTFTVDPKLVQAAEVQAQEAAQGEASSEATLSYDATLAADKPANYSEVFDFKGEQAQVSEDTAAANEAIDATNIVDAVNASVAEAEDNTAAHSADNVENHRVIPVLLKNFSAPVKLKAMYNSGDYFNMLVHADDAFIRMDAFRSLVNEYVHQHIDKATSGDLPEPVEIIKATEHVLMDQNIDLQLKAMLLKIPDLMTLMETFKRIDLDGLYAVRNFLEQSIAKALVNTFENVEQSLVVKGKYHYNPSDAAKRAAHNACLNMLILGYKATDQIDKADDKIFKAYDNATNMTDRLAAFTIAVHQDLPCKIKLLDDFADRYQNDALTFDKFFSVQATVSHEDTVSLVRKLSSHPRFDITNPNRVRALIGSLAYNNPIALHRKDGNGYRLIVDMIKKLVKINPSVAARILDGMINYKRLDDARGAKAIEYLNKIKSLPNISRSVYEKVVAALPEEEKK